ncbi:MAG: radical SAM protein [Thermodesulfobacteriota bacterium]
MKPIFHIQWHITHLCNLRCEHCYQEDFSREKDLDWIGLREVAHNLLTPLQDWDQIASIHLTGGEPLLKLELFPLLSHLNQNPVVEELGIITNGLHFDQEVVERLSGLPKLRKIKISLDGANEEVNDSIRGKGVFKRVIENILWIKKESPFEIILMFTLMRRNYRSLPSFLNLAQELGAHGFILERFIPWGRGREMKGEVLGREEWKELMGMLSELFSIEEKNHLLSYQAFQIHLSEDEPELLGAPCIIGRDGLCVMPEGDVFPCRRFPIPIGNLLETSLRQIWEESEILKKLRGKENLKGKCGRCNLRDCRGCRSLALALSGDYLEEDPHCWYGQG